jgi:hypothetical protein
LKFPCKNFIPILNLYIHQDKKYSMLKVQMVRTHTDESFCQI